VCIKGRLAAYYSLKRTKTFRALRVVPGVSGENKKFFKKQKQIKQQHSE
jgi:hypothetical protein